ncbi:hypothetical protein EVAR_10381_1 [Eumeta japonica]|uniref:Uncharacterized protein n=1 Tax=Eumeta variegata TaxID=151549 RepID=A0A4C1UDF7_EUMVA|nr:hypothetical protein EVAR_10381_1 [Eumeta japonica]
MYFLLCDNEPRRRPAEDVHNSQLSQIIPKRTRSTAASVVMAFTRHDIMHRVDVACGLLGRCEDSMEFSKYYNGSSAQFEEPPRALPALYDRIVCAVPGRSRVE